MAVNLNIENALSSTVGPGNGINKNDLKSLNSKAKEIHKDLTAKRKKGDIGFYDLPYNDNIVQIIKAIAHVVRRKFEFFVHVGIGGSCLGPRFLCNAMNHSFHGMRQKRHLTPRFLFLDNPDPATVNDLLDIINLGSTAFFVVSKSGSTDETMAIFSILYSRVLKRLGSHEVGEHFVVATTPQAQGPLLTIAEKEKMRILPIPDNVGGRYSVFSPVGLYPAAVGGLNITKLLEGAASMDERTKIPNLEDNPAYLNAAVQYLLHTECGKSISFMMPYADAFWDFSRWYEQLHAESLGKIHKDGTRVGQTPLASLGTVDQHSLLQLILQGPRDKSVTLLGLDKVRKDLKIPNVFRYEKRIDYLRGNQLSQIMKCEMDATEFALTRNGIPNVRVNLDAVDEFHLGELLYMYEVQTAFAGGLYGINPFDQPGVEEGKIVARTLLGKKGLLKADMKKAFNAHFGKNKK
jgi:glucose-6-phosphate isomerase